MHFELCTASIAITQAGAGGDTQCIQTHAALRADGSWLLNGSMHFISDAEFSSFFNVSARTGDQKMMGLRGNGFKMAMQVLGAAHLAQVGARCVGRAVHVLELTANHCEQRNQFGQARSRLV
jgi:acyl-CoA dehydrogenase